MRALPDLAEQLSPPGLRADAARNRERILAAAREMLGSGDERLQMNSIARSAGVGVGTVYRHFADRQELIEGLAAAALQSLTDEVRAAVEEADAAAGFERMLSAALDAQLCDAALAAVLSDSEPACALALNLTAELKASIGELVERARAAGAIRDDIGAEDIRRLVSGIVQAVQAGPDTPATRERYLRVLVAGVRSV
jgi:AcrR family transcriptional regulator